MFEIKRKHGRDAPRSWMSLYWAKDGWFFAFLLMFAGVSMAAYFAQSANAERFKASGMVVQAVVTDKRVQQKGNNDRYFMTFKFALQDGQMVVSESQVPKHLYRQVGKGAQTPIRYLLGQPTQLETYIGESRSSLWGLLILALIFGVLGLGFFWMHSKRTNMAILARQYGRRAVGKVVGIEKVPWNRTILPKGRLVWRDEDGCRGVSLIYRRRFLSRYRPGEHICIFMQNGKSWWEGDVGPRKCH